MTTEMAGPTFRGVLCLHCKAPVPVPAIVAGMQSADDGMESSQGRSQVFNLRCPYCLKEKPYWTEEILDFEGVPETTLTFERAFPLHLYPKAGMARAAKV